MATTTRPRTSIRGIRAANQKIGHHWLDRGTMEFHGTQITSEVIVFLGESYFYASHRYEHPSDASKDGPVIYTLQHAAHSGRIHTVGPDVCDGGYPDMTTARADFTNAIKQDRECLGWDG